MKKFEYKILQFQLEKDRMRIPGYNPEELEKALNQLGNEGWELVAQLPRTSVAAEYSAVFVFKREK
jgi:hypothetical protein